MYVCAVASGQCSMRLGRPGPVVRAADHSTACGVGFHKSWTEELTDLGAATVEKGLVPGPGIQPCGSRPQQECEEDAPEGPAKG